MVTCRRLNSSVHQWHMHVVFHWNMNRAQPGPMQARQAGTGTVVRFQVRVTATWFEYCWLHKVDNQLTCPEHETATRVGWCFGLHAFKLLIAHWCQPGCFNQALVACRVPLLGPRLASGARLRATAVWLRGFGNATQLGAQDAGYCNQTQSNESFAFFHAA